MTTEVEEVGARLPGGLSGNCLGVRAFLAGIPAHDACTRSAGVCAGLFAGTHDNMQNMSRKRMISLCLSG